MRVGIFTFHHVYNFGALLQVYALQKYLSQQGWMSEIVDIRPFYRYPPGAPRRGRLRRYVWRIKRKMGLIGKSPKEIKFDSFRKSKLAIGPRVNSPKEVFSHYKDRFDAFIVGSDQVWDPRFGRLAQDVYFLRHIPEGVKCFSYAACAGSKLSKSAHIGKYKDDLGRFDAISVRDEFTKDIVSPLVDQEVVEVVDPTLLIDWSQEVEETVPPVKGDYVFYYGCSKNGDSAVRQLRNRSGMKVVAVGMENDCQFPEDVEILKDIGPLEWVSLACNASAVVTKSFHGMMFSLRFGKPVIVTPGDRIAFSRIEDAGKRYKMGDLIIPPEMDLFDANHIIDSFRPDEVKQALMESLEKSQGFLGSVLS